MSPKYISTYGEWKEVSTAVKKEEVAKETTDDTKADTVEFDLNRDSVVDKKDASIAGKVLNATKVKKPRAKKAKKVIEPAIEPAIESSKESDTNSK